MKINKDKILDDFETSIDNGLKDTRYRAMEKIVHEAEMRFKGYVTEYMLYYLPAIVVMGIYFFYGLISNAKMSYGESFEFFGVMFWFLIIVSMGLTFLSIKYLKPIIGEAIGTQHKEITEDVYQKGARFITTHKFNSSMEEHIQSFTQFANDEKEVQKLQEVFLLETTQLSKEDKNYEDRPSNIIFPRISLATGIILFGRPGSGKSSLINNLIKQIPNNNTTKTIIIDVKGEFLVKHYNPHKDLIICPSDIRTHRFDLHELIRTRVDAANIANIIVPDDKTSQDPHWVNAARAVMEAVLHYSAIHSLSNSDIFKLVSTPELLLTMMQEDEELKLIAGRYIRFENGVPGKETDSILSTLARKAKILQYISYMDELDNDKVTLKKWLKDGKGGKIFLLADENLASVYAPLYGVITSYIISLTLSDADTKDRDLYLILDELPRLGKSLGDNLEKALAVGRSKGFKIISAAQGISQVKEEFGEKKADSILDTSNSYITFGSNVGAQFTEKYFGKTTVLRNKEGFSFGMDSMADRVTVNRDVVKEALVDDSEIQRLKVFECYMKIEGCTDVLKTKFKPVFIQDQNVEKYLENPKMNIEKMENEISRICKKIANGFVNLQQAKEKASELGTVSIEY